MFECSNKIRIVPLPSPHIDKVRRDHYMKYDMSIQDGQTIVNIVAPPPMTEEEKQKVLRDYHNAGWAIIKSLYAKDASV